MRPTISVVVPVHNGPQALMRALASIESQSVLPHEVIIVDDASDWPAERLPSIVDQALSIEWRAIRFDTNRGPSAARNTAWSVAGGDWLAFLDADEVWHPDKIAILSDLIEGCPDAIAIGHATTTVDDISRPQGLVSIRADRPTALLTEIGLGELLRRNWFTTPGMLVKRDINFRFEESMRYCEDYLLWCQIGSMRTIYYFPQVLGFRLAERGLSTHLLRMERGELQVFRHLHVNGQIGRVTQLLASSWSVVRFGRRLVLSRARVVRRVIP